MQWNKRAHTSPNDLCRHLWDIFEQECMKMGGSQTQTSKALFLENCCIFKINILLLGICPPAPLVFLIENNNSVLSSVSQTPNALFFLSFFFFLNESKAPRLHPMQPQQCKPIFCSSLWQLCPSFVPLPVCRSRSRPAVGDCRKLVESSHKASFMSQI